jgi:hypothetical protein
MAAMLEQFLSDYRRAYDRLAGELPFNGEARRIAGFIGAARPDLTERQCYDLALEVAALLEGLMVYTDPGADSVRSREYLTELVKDSVLRLITLPERR